MTSQDGPRPLTEAELDEFALLDRRATPGPWFVRDLDDDQAMGLVAVSTAQDTGKGERWPDFDHGEMVAATLIQHPRYVDIADANWQGNALFIAGPEKPSRGWWRRSGGCGASWTGAGESAQGAKSGLEPLGGALGRVGGIVPLGRAGGRDRRG